MDSDLFLKTLFRWLVVVALIGAGVALGIAQGWSPQTFWQKNPDFCGLVRKKIREMGFHLMPRCCHTPIRNTNDPSASVNICFVDAHVEMRKKSEIPIISTNVFWIGQN